jgi:multidrug efflux pump subunit AcrA (membrane-fusion protein)
MKKGSTKGRFGQFSLHVWPVMIWLMAVCCVVVLFQHRRQRFEVLGIVQGRMHQISAPVDGRLKTISVDLFETVTKGQTLAILEHSQLDAQIAVIQAEIDHLAALLPATEDAMLAEAANLQNDTLVSQRRLYADVENARLRLLDLKLSIETDKVTLEDLAVELKAARELYETEAIAPYEWQKAEAQYNALAKKIEASQVLLARAEQDLEAARNECDAFSKHQPAHPSVDIALEAIRKEIVVQEKMIDELAVQREAMKLVSPVDGKVVQIQIKANQTVLRRQGEDILRQPGEVVLAGNPILVVAETEPTEIVAYVAQHQAAKVSEKMVVQIIKNNEPAQIASSQVIRLGPSMELVPQQLWLNPKIAQWGRPVLIKIPPGLNLIPGETIGIKGL